MADGETREYMFEDSLENGAVAWNNSGATASISAEGDPAVGGSGSSLKVVADAWAQGGVYRAMSVAAETEFLHFDIYREPGSGGQLVLRHGNGWTTVRLDDSNYGLWTIDGLDSAEDLSGIPEGTWAHVTVDLVGLVGAGTELQAFGVFGSYLDGNTFFLDNIYLSDSAAVGGGGSNAAPAAAADAYVTNEDAALTIPAAGVLANDTDADGDALTAVVETGPTNGALTLNADGSFTYAPNADFNGVDSFTYIANDGEENSAPVTVSLTVNAVNDAPVAAPEIYQIDEDTSLPTVASSVLRNDTDAEGDALTAVVLSGPAHGAFAMNDDGSFTYTPDTNFFGDDTFTYVANDGVANSAPVTVTLRVLPVNDAPVATGEIYSIVEDSVLWALSFGVLYNDTDADGDALTAAVRTGPAHGVLDMNADGTFTYTPDTNFNGTDTFVYVANDGIRDSAPTTVTLTMAPVNDAPVVGQTVADQTASEGEAYSFVVPDGAFTDVDGDVLEVRATLPNYDPLPAWLSYDITTQTFSGTPRPDDAGEITIRLQAHDGGDVPAYSFFQLNVNEVQPPNSAPVGVADTYNISEDSSLTMFPIGGVLANDTDVDGDALSAVLQTGPTNGALTLNADGSFTYAADANFNGSDTFTYVANDGSADSAPTTVTINVAPVNDAPIAFGETINVDEDSYTSALPGSSDRPGILDNDTDVDGDTLTTVLQTGPTNGTFNFSSNGRIFYEPNPGFNGTDTITYVVTDGIGNSTPVTTTINVRPIAAPAEISFGQPGPIVPLDANDVRVNTTTELNQLRASIAELADGGFIVTWQSVSRIDGVSDSNIAAQRFGADGEPVGGEILVNSNLPGSQYWSIATGLAGGGFAMVWRSEDGGAYARSFGADGTPLGDDVGLESFVATGSYLTVESLEDGGFIVVGSGAGGLNAGVFDSGGTLTGAPFVVSATSSGSFASPSIAHLPDGDLVIAWRDAGDRISFQRLDSEANLVGEKQTIAATEAVRIASPSIAALADGGFVVTWRTGVLSDTDPMDIMAQRFDQNGVEVGEAFLVNDYTPGIQSEPNVRGLSDGGFLISWTSAGQDGSNAGIYAQKFGSDGAPEGNSVRLNKETVGDQEQSQEYLGDGLAVRADGTVVQVFGGEGEIFIRRFDATVSEVLVSGDEDSVIAIPVSVTPVEINDQVSEVILSGLPSGSVLSAGTSNEDGSEWTFAGAPPTDLTLTPPANFNGTFVLTVTATTVDGASTATTSADVDVLVAAVNDAPVVAQTVADQNASEGQAFSLILPDNIFTDADGDDLPMSVTLGNYFPLPDWLSYDPATRTLSGTPGDGDGGEVGVRLQVNDGNGGVAYTFFDITVDAPPPFNSPPVANADVYSTAEDTALTIVAPGILGNDTDAEGDPLSVSLYALPTNGTLNWSTNGSFTYTPNADFNGVDVFTYRAFDDTVVSEPVTVTIDVAPVNDAPVAFSDAVAATEGGEVIVDVLGNDTDVEGDTLTVTHIAGQAVSVGGSVAIGSSSVMLNGDNTLTVTPGAGSAGVFEFNYTVSDGVSATVGDTVVAVSPAGPAETREYFFEDSLLNDAVAWNNSGATASISSPGEPVVGESGSSLKVVADAWSQSGVYRNTTVDADQGFLHFDVYREAGSEGQLVVRHGNGWETVRLDDSNYGLWSIEGVDSAEDLSEIPAETWEHVTVDLVGLVGAGTAFQAVGVFGYSEPGNTYFLDNIYLSDSASSDGASSAPPSVAEIAAAAAGAAADAAAAAAAAAAAEGESGETPMMFAIESLPETFDFSSASRGGFPRDASILQDDPTGVERAISGLDEATGSFIFANTAPQAERASDVPSAEINQSGMQFGELEPVHAGVEPAGGPNLDGGAFGSEGLLGSDAFLLE